MMRSLYTGVSGLTNHQTRMDVLSNNIANVNTIGFKSSRTIFSDALSQTSQGATAPRGNVGGINAKQIGLGMKVSSIDILFTKSSFQTTNVNTDLAINNNGFFIVANGGQQYYTRAGNFYFDAEGNFVTNEGLHVMGWYADKNGNISTAQDIKALQLPVVATMEPKTTTNLNFTAGNLKADAELGTATSAAKNLYDTEGYAHDARSTFTKVGDNTWLAYTNVTNIEKSNPAVPNDDDIRGNVKLVTFDGNGKYMSSVSLDKTKIAGQFDQYGDPVAGTDPFSSTIILNAKAALGEKLSSSLVIVDSNGVVRALGMTATCTKAESTNGANDAEWRIDITEDGRIVGSASYTGGATGKDVPQLTLVDGSVINLNNAGISKVDITGTTSAANNFNIVNNFADPAYVINPLLDTTNPNLTFTPTGSSNPQPQTVVADFSGLSQYAGQFNDADPQQNGYPMGTLMEKTINAAGIVVGIYSNGQQLNLAQIATCIFNNQAGLERAGSTLFTKSNNSGDPIIGAAGEGGRGSLQAGVLEMANVDLAEEFTNMIVTQRGYQSNSRIITTSDEMLQELLNLKR